jgi:hypothetical protein
VTFGPHDDPPPRGAPDEHRHYAFERSLDRGKGLARDTRVRWALNAPTVNNAAA